MRADPVTEFVADEELAEFLGDLAEVIADAANRMPDHGEFVRGLPPSSQVQPEASPRTTFALRYERGETVG